MAKSSRRGRGKKPLTISLAVVAGFVPTAAYAIEGFRRGGETGFVEGLARITARLTGYSITENKFHGMELVKGYGPVLLGGVAHVFASRIGLNRMIARAGIPIFRI
jgi:hypothetical protein